MLSIPTKPANFLLLLFSQFIDSFFCALLDDVDNLDMSNQRVMSNQKPIRIFEVVVDF